MITDRRAETAIWSRVYAAVLVRHHSVLNDWELARQRASHEANQAVQQLREAKN